MNSFLSALYFRRDRFLSVAFLLFIKDSIKQTGEARPLFSILFEYIFFDVGAFISLTHEFLRETEKPSVSVISVLSKR